ncbi:5'-nucleotidase, lipoprotein e(P4) family [Neptunicella sp. SCSIO 80796]|uniref:5'-nucleotidase, lipoprotein e(P4) family n=1 Tax=Neptunicella plasticusilytica TaxID=3117012 RepID=UPI003A4D6770
MSSFSFRAAALSAAIICVSVTQPCFAKNTNDNTYSQKELNQQSVMAVLWTQVSGEYRALSYQAFNLAKMSLDHYLANRSGDKKVAIVVDADETVLNNSAYNAWLVTSGEGYSQTTWQQWMDAAQAKAMPGATEFLNYVKQQGAEVFYITNRYEKGREGTIKNMQVLGFPFVDNDHLLLRTDTGNKEPRRQQVLKNYDIALLMGDNLSDFSNALSPEGLDDTLAAVDNNKTLFGNRYIVLPNPMYGDWEGKVYQHNWRTTPGQKSDMRKGQLHSWVPQ